jgi:hypothetical protein
MSGFTLAIIGFGIATATAIRWALLLVSVSIPRNRSGFIALMLLGAGLGITALAIGTQSLVADIAAGLASRREALANFKSDRRLRIFRHRMKTMNPLTSAAFAESPYY